VAQQGIYGGTFNPIHTGHLRAADEVREALGLSRIVFVPSARPPHKAGDDYDPIAPAKLRLEWLELAIANEPNFEVDPIEVEREGPSYLVDTLRVFRERAGNVAPVFIVGRDAFAEMDTWKSPRELFRLANFAVTNRPPVSGCIGDWLPEAIRDDVELAEDGRSVLHKTAGTWIRQIEITALDVSASAIRQRVREGRSIRFLVPAKVVDAIAKARCYESSERDERDEGKENV